ncbi:Hemerythrin HHE cation binding domain-containing protein [Micromonospora pattaloongensis]|uniref:Hemerythrin HHE cation binding domain-containing protein n=1 Tax=Micromonospora pattaloongensis TaxID=405436 RepID=A0A1H3NSA2_9ACTN|nr:hemerythrin domain-containing protein [Micromonospora pattaloongensis]SDY91305.1 Hemerythrin HHE cation binding domain-containing protein [Micromonospora pattaloongensis]
MTTAGKQDVVELLLDQHNQIKSLFSRVATEPQGAQKRELFEQLVHLLAVHETAEEEVVHPYARRKIEAGEQVVERRQHEEDKAKRELAALYDMGVDHPDFNAKLQTFSEEVLQHANREESEEFARLRQTASQDQLTRMAGAVRAAEATAPTRPHPHSGESATANLVAGPPLAVFDRARDAVRDWRQKQGSE